MNTVCGYIQFYSSRQLTIPLDAEYHKMKECQYLSAMKKQFLLLLLFTGAFQLTVFASTDSIPAHLKGLPLPDFKIQLVDGKTDFYTEQLSPDKKTMIMYFSPECDHCRYQTLEIIKHINELSELQIVMATVLPFEKMKQFYDELKISQYKNIIMGRDVLFFFPKYFRNQYLPGIAVYDKNKTLLNFYDGGVKTEELIKLVNR